MSTTSCLEKMYEIKQYSKDFISDIRKEFIRKSVIANWGQRKAYIVYDVVFNQNPYT